MCHHVRCMSEQAVFCLKKPHQKLNPKGTFGKTDTQKPHEGFMFRKSVPTGAYKCYVALN